MIEFEFDIRKEEARHNQQDVELIYVLDGKVNLIVDDKSHTLGHDDFIIINPGQTHSFSSESDIFLGRFTISTEKLRDLLKQNLIKFNCNSTLEGGDDDAYEEARAVLKEIFLRFNAGSTQDVVGMQMVYYKLLYVLTGHFLVQGDQSDPYIQKHGQDTRRDKIEEYIKQNYDKAIRLTDLAEKLHLSTAYLSKYIKKSFNMSFLEYVNRVRLRHGITELMGTEKSIARISMDIGFANLTAFNKVFKETYKVTPSVFRRQYANGRRGKALSDAPQDILPDPKSTAEAVKIPGAEDILTLPQVRAMHQTVQVTEGERKLLNRNWNRMINIGAAKDILRSDVQAHIVEMKDRLGFKHVRFWDIYAPEMFLDRHTGSDKYNFYMLDKVLDFLLSNGLKPYIELAHKPKNIFVQEEEFSVRNNIADIFSVSGSLEHFAEELAAHLVERYGGEELESWYFEYWVSEIGNKFSPETADRDTEDYLYRFDAVAQALRRNAPGVMIGGGGFWIRPGRDNFVQVMKAWNKHEQHPFFISLYCYPYDLEEEAVISNRAVVQDMLHGMLRHAAPIIERTGMKVREMHVSEWNMTRHNKKMLNDTCYKGAYMMRNIINNIGMADILGYWIGSDLYAEHSGAEGVIDGVSGLLTRDGIKKPSWYAIQFMNELGRWEHKKGENYIVTSDGGNKWAIACHNFKSLNYRYYLARQDLLEIPDMDKSLSDITKLVLRFEMPCPKGKSFRLKISTINRNKGSVQEEWIRMYRPNEPDQSELEYLKCSSTPGLTVRNLYEEDGQINVETMLEPNEIQLIKINIISD